MRRTFRTDAPFYQGCRRLHVHHFRAAWVADRPDATNEQHRVLVDGERRILDVAVIIFRAVEHDGAALEGIRILWVGQITLPEFIADDARFHDRGIEKISGQHFESCLLHQGPTVGADHVGVAALCLGDVLTHGFAVDGKRVSMDAAGGGQFMHDRRQPARAIIFLAEIPAGRLHVNEQRNVVAKCFPVTD